MCMRPRSIWVSGHLAAYPRSANYIPSRPNNTAAQALPGQDFPRVPADTDRTEPVSSGEKAPHDTRAPYGDVASERQMRSLPRDKSQQGRDTRAASIETCLMACRLFSYGMLLDNVVLDPSAPAYTSVAFFIKLCRL